jgi:Domain of unknown function (DUF4893)
VDGGMTVLAVLAGVVLQGCAAATAAVVPGQVAACAATPKPDWRAVATRDDIIRIRTWRDAFVKGLDEAKGAGFAADVAAQGALLEPDAALEGPALPTGAYRCRTIKLGSASGGPLAYVAYPAFRCRVKTEGDRLLFEKVTGSQRPFGTLYPGGARRQIFLGTVILGDETRAPVYGRDALRDQVGAVERIGPQRWRLIFPYPRFESTLDVIELVPAS